jgi:lipopolysaccharide transport system permease protein
MFGEIYSHRRLIAQLAVNDFRGRYAGSVLGGIWAVVQPLTMIVMYTVIFAVVLKVKVGVRGGVTEFGLFLICGMIPFNTVADAIRRSSGIYLEFAHMMRRIPMPPLVLPAARVLTVLLEFAIVQVLFLGLLVVAGHPPGALAPGFLLLMPMHVAMALGLALVISSLTVLVRDIAALTESVLTIWFLATPVFYPRSMVPPLLRPVIDANPMTPLVEGFRAFLLQNALPPWGDPLYLALTSGFLLLAGRWVYGQTRAVIIDHV